MDDLLKYYDDISNSFQGGCGKPTPFLVDPYILGV
jgi:hypothetical protein